MKDCKLLLLFFVLGSLIASCGKVESPEFRKLDSFKVKKLDFQKADLGFNVTYFNPNNFGVSVKEAEIDIFVDSVYLGKFVQEQEIDVIKKSEFSLPLKGSVSIAKALQLNLNDITNRQVLVKANGAVKVGKAGIFITKPINYQGKHKVDLNLIKNPAF
ncbi:LEA type 2 family protein [Chitinophagaceae bacterium LB-8]|uniref:LEA type 2 family protein n=1 Tax=Paraflavisolibacter caeni TaxID=2982496 RepID=A0A9X3B838_9BACT|nr:LEA type 2 family protein [Paraflavisolibacter caeni]MCU7549156.1 LEA type 2 family protein [Paraflavisolibacter caeni]